MFPDCVRAALRITYPVFVWLPIGPILAPPRNSILSGDNLPVLDPELVAKFNLRDRELKSRLVVRVTRTCLQKGLHAPQRAAESGLL